MNGDLAEITPKVRRTVLLAILVISLTILTLLFWILYFRVPSGDFSDRLLFLPALNAGFNAASAIFLLFGLRAIRHRQPRAHMRHMLTACFFSFLFLVSYILHHWLHGSTTFMGPAPVRLLYIGILVTHILVAALTLPLLLTTLYLALSGRFRSHRRLARVTFPAWMYMSVTGVLIFLLLRAFGSV